MPNPGLADVDRGLFAIGDLQLMEDVGDVVGDHLRAQGEQTGKLSIGSPFAMLVAAVHAGSATSLRRWMGTLRRLSGCVPATTSQKDRANALVKSQRSWSSSR